MFGGGVTFRMDRSWKSGEVLPGVDNAEIDPRKFQQYSMNPGNPANQGKWMAFAAIGYAVESEQERRLAAQDAIAQLRRAIVNTPATLDRNSIHGTRFEVKVQIQGPNGGIGTLVTKWQIDRDTDFPRLITNWLEVYR